MGTRLELHEVLRNVLASSGTMTAKDASTRIYFQPPSNAQMVYPCIVYSLDHVDSKYANNLPYGHDKRYTVMVIDRNPDSAIPDLVGDLPVSSFKTKYEKNNLNHFVFQLYF